jgi:rubrerythrin
MPENYMDQLKKALKEGWRHFFNALHPDHHQKLLEMLRDAYLEEAQDVAQFTQDAERMYYPQFRERLLRIAAEEQAHVTWLRDKLRALGGKLPAVSSPPKGAKNAWQALLMDLEEEKRSYADLLEAMLTAEQDNPEIAEGLRRIREGKRSRGRSEKFLRAAAHVT